MEVTKEKLIEEIDSIPEQIQECQIKIMNKSFEKDTHSIVLETKENNERAEVLASGQYTNETARKTALLKALDNNAEFQQLKGRIQLLEKEINAEKIHYEYLKNRLRALEMIVSLLGD